MIKKISVIVLIVLLSNIKSVSAATFYNYLPGGKNYLDESNFNFSGNSMSTIHSFLVEGSTYYTLSFPGTEWLETNIYVTIDGTESYIDEYVENDSNCTVSEQEVVCIFETQPNEDYIDLTISASALNGYYSYYGFYGFQLEVGQNDTSYEEYIAPFIDTGNPEFSGSGAYIKSYSTFETIEEIVSDHITVFDDVDGDISNDIVILIDQYTGNENIIGDYLVKLSASDSSGNTAIFNLSILVKDEVSPTIIGPNSVEYEIFYAPSLMDIIDEVFVIEDEYSATTIHILVDNYTLNNDSIGTYSVEFEAVDNDLNSIIKSFEIVLVDNDSPTVISELNINSYLSNPLTLQEVLNSLEFNDNYTDMSDATVNIISNEFVGNENKKGSYIINFEVSDESNNSLNKNLVINVIDDVVPQIGGPLTYQGSYTEELTIDDFKDMISVSDNVGIISLDDVYVITDTYTNRSSVTGSFLISFGVLDESSNESIHTINITLFDDVAPIIYVDNFIVTVDMESTFTTDDAVKLLINSEELMEGSYSVRVLFDEYTGNEDVEGSYLYSLEFTDDSGVSYEKEFVVKVIDELDSKVNKNLLFRNITLYSISIGVFGYVVYKNKK